MRFVLRFIFVGLIGFLCGSYLPQFPLWPSMAGAFLVGLLLSRKKKKWVFGKKQKPTYAFLAGFLALLIVWGLVAFTKDSANASLLSEKIGGVFDVFLGMEGEWLIPKPNMLVLITALIGGLAGGLSIMTGNLLGEAIKS
ncbi:MAG: hypothetical protein MRZ79_02185 [Bacteroidia bacterium]|nr:hypothetical protein [Bacteroidia bacterium]